MCTSGNNLEKLCTLSRKKILFSISCLKFSSLNLTSDYIARLSGPQ